MKLSVWPLIQSAVGLEVSSQQKSFQPKFHLYCQELAEGNLAEGLFKRAIDEGCNMEINWQDNDSSAAQVMFCSGHVE